MLVKEAYGEWAMLAYGSAARLSNILETRSQKPSSV
jgi:hypothetical protein